VGLILVALAAAALGLITRDPFTRGPFSKSPESKAPVSKSKRIADLAIASDEEVVTALLQMRTEGMNQLVAGGTFPIPTKLMPMPPICVELGLLLGDLLAISRSDHHRSNPWFSSGLGH